MEFPLLPLLPPQEVDAPLNNQSFHFRATSEKSRQNFVYRVLMKNRVEQKYMQC